MGDDVVAGEDLLLFYGDAVGERPLDKGGDSTEQFGAVVCGVGDRMVDDCDSELVAA